MEHWNKIQIETSIGMKVARGCIRIEEAERCGVALIRSIVAKGTPVISVVEDA